MHSRSSMRTKIPQSRIPVPIVKQKASNLNNIENRLLSQRPIAKSEVLYTNKASNTHLSKKELEQRCGSQTGASGKDLTHRTIRNSSLKQSSLKTCTYIDNKKFTVRTNARCNLNKKETMTTLKSNVKKVKEKTLPTVKVFEKPNINKKQAVQTSKNKVKSSDSMKENLPILKTNTLCDDARKLHTPQAMSTKKKSVLDCFSAQKGIKFEANEFYRNMILNNRELSPSVCKFMPTIRASSVQCERPSAYQKFEVPLDPVKEALKAIEDVRLSVKRTTKSSVKETKVVTSTYKDRGSFYTPCVDPKAEVMKSLDELKLKRLQKSLLKSTKKVTFNLNVEECSSQNACDTKANQVKNSECRLTQINEKSEEITPGSPQSEKTEVLPVSIPIPEFPKRNNECIEHQETKAPNQTDFSQGDNCTNIKLKGCVAERPVFKSTHSSGATVTPIKLPIHHKEALSTKVYTPRPISLFSKSTIIDNSSPEFLVKGKSAILSEFAPICTPLVLKSIAKNNILSPDDLSPVRLKLDFTEVEKDTPKTEASKMQKRIPLENIATLQKKLDDLADQECSVLLLKERIPVICGRYLINPVASTLSEGDDMHFIPIQL